LRDPHRTFATSAQERHRRAREVPARLDRTLDRLERLLGLDSNAR